MCASSSWARVGTALGDLTEACYGRRLGALQAQTGSPRSGVATVECRDHHLHCSDRRRSGRSCSRCLRANEHAFHTLRSFASEGSTRYACSASYSARSAIWTRDSSLSQHRRTVLTPTPGILPSSIKAAIRMTRCWRSASAETRPFPGLSLGRGRAGNGAATVGLPRPWNRLSARRGKSHRRPADSDGSACAAPGCERSRRRRVPAGAAPEPPLSVSPFHACLPPPIRWRVVRPPINQR